MRERDRAIRLLVEIRLLMEHYHIEYDRRGLRWVLIRDFRLPNFCSHSWGPVLLPVPLVYPHTPPQGFWIHGGIARHDHPLHPDGVAMDEWVYFSLQLENWQPTSDLANGDNLLTFLNEVSRFVGHLHGPNSPE